MSWELPDKRRDEDELARLMPDPDRRDHALSRILLAVYGVRQRNSRQRRLSAYFARRLSHGERERN